MNRQNETQGISNDTTLIYWVDRLSDENKRIEQKITKETTSKIALPGSIITIADWNEAIRKFAGSFLFKKTETSYYRMMVTYLGKAVGIDIRMSNHPAGDDENWLLTEGNGLSNCRLSIYFRGDTSATTRDCTDGVPLYEQGFHYEHLKNASVLGAIRNGIIGFMKSGVYNGVSQPIIESDDIVAERQLKKEIARNEKKKTRYFAGTNPDIESEQPKQVKETKLNKNTKQNVIKLNETQLKMIVAESVKKILKEYLKK